MPWMANFGPITLPQTCLTLSYSKGVQYDLIKINIYECKKYNRQTDLMLSDY